MNKESFKEKAMNILERQMFGDMPLFESCYLEDFEVGDESGSMELELFLNELYEEINND